MNKSVIVVSLICALIVFFVYSYDNNSDVVVEDNIKEFHLFDFLAQNNNDDKKTENQTKKQTANTETKEDTKKQTKEEPKKETVKKEVKTETKEEPKKETTSTNSEQKNNIVLNKYYVDVQEQNPSKALQPVSYVDYDGNSHTGIPVTYIKFLNSSEVEVNYACTGEDMCVIKTTYDIYVENNVKYIKIYELLGGKHSVIEAYFLCSGLNEGYALLKLNNDTLSVISHSTDFDSLDLTGAKEFKLY